MSLLNVVDNSVLLAALQEMRVDYLVVPLTIDEPFAFYSTAAACDRSTGTRALSVISGKSSRWGYPMEALLAELRKGSSKLFVLINN